eukprot:TRINITY_DN22891_c0_g1_i1.p1 TRINITY_DN22891_c0_g1~~TRINITY_DN22891_c0_g1_i1.p1  ORF type:complete len:108 (+),score=8.79 TRINITY_DN22891_c0_g1_i1:49-372(+)
MRPSLQVITKNTELGSHSPKSAQLLATPLPIRKKIPMVLSPDFKRNCVSTQGYFDFLWNLRELEIPDPISHRGGGYPESCFVDHIVERSGAMNGHSRDMIFLNQGLE